MTVRMVEAIRHAYAGGQSQTRIAAEYGVSRMTVSRTVRGEQYKDLPGPIAPKKTPTKMRFCWRGHDMRTNRRADGWCRGCHTFRNRVYQQRRRAAKTGT